MALFGGKITQGFHPENALGIIFRKKLLPP
jgi:hypothetical protein